MHALGEARANAFLQAYGRGMLNIVATIIDDGRSTPESIDWRLVKVNADGELTGRNVGGLHEDLLEFDRQLSSKRSATE